MNILLLAIKNLKSNVLRTSLTVVGVAVAVFVFSFFLSMQATMENVVTQAGKQNNLIVLQGNAWWTVESRIPASYAEMILEVPEVEDAMAVYISTTGWWVFEPDQVIVHGVDKERFEKFRDYTVVEGSMAAFREARDGALLGANVAARKGWKVGDTIDLRAQLGLLMEVKGIFLSGSEEQDNTILAGIEYVQDQYDARGQANIIMVKLPTETRAEDVAATIDAMPTPTGTNSQPEKAFVSAMIEDLGDMIALSRVVILITLLVVFVSVANSVSMSVRDRTRQLGVMRTLGFRRWQIMALVVTESSLVCLLGGAIGVAVAWLAISFQDVSVQARSLNLAVAMPWAVMFWAMLASFVIGFAGSLLSGFRASRLKLVEAIGNVE